jgi:simple sugar transport system permease protein
MIPVILVAGALAGALLMLIPTILRVRFSVDEVVTTLLLNFVVLLFVQMMLEGALRDPMSMGWPQSEPLLPEATLPRLIARSRVHAGLIIAIVASVVLWVVMKRSLWGYEMRTVGANRVAARFAGIPVMAVMIRVGLISGALAGLAGVVEVAGLRGYLTQDLSPGYGYNGIVVAMLAQLNPLGVLGAAFFIATVFVGADSMGRAMGVSSYIAELIVATSLLTMLLAGLLTRYRVRWRA